MNEHRNQSTADLHSRLTQLIQEYAHILFSDNRDALPGLEERIYKLQDEISKRNGSPAVFPFKAPPVSHFKYRP